MSTTQVTAAQRIAALASFAVLMHDIDTMASDGERAKKAATKFKGAQSTLTARLADTAREMREAGVPVTMGEKAGSGTTQAYLYEQFCAKLKKPQASKISRLVCWLALHPECEPLCVKGKGEDGKPIWHGYNAAFVALQAKLDPKPRTWRDTLAELQAYMTEDADDALRDKLRLIPAEALVAAIERYFTVDVPDTDATPMAQGMLAAMQQSAAQEAHEKAMAD